MSFRPNNLRPLDVEALRTVQRALDFLTVSQIYLEDNFCLDRPLATTDLVLAPVGHWGTCPPTNLVLAAILALQDETVGGARVLPVFGAGHAVASARAFYFLSGALGPSHQFSDGHSIAAFVRAARRGEFGVEVSPMLPGQNYMGGQIGGALATAQGMTLRQPDALVIPLVGDGEAETGATAAAWLGMRALRGLTGRHGTVMPVLLLNEWRMGSRSLLSQLSDVDIARYFDGLGWDATIIRTEDAAEFAQTFLGVMQSAKPMPVAPQLLVLRAAKGFGCVTHLDGFQLSGTSAMHKTPLKDPATRPEERVALQTWLKSYDPQGLVEQGQLARALVHLQVPPNKTNLSKHAADAPAAKVSDAGACVEGLGSFADAVGSALSANEGTLVFSPDELSSNKLDPTRPPFFGETVEVLNEELCHLWHQGAAFQNQKALFISYEAFAGLNVSWVRQYAKTLLLRPIHQEWASLNYLVTSLGWFNTNSHQEHSIVDAFMSCDRRTRRVLYPPDLRCLRQFLCNALANKNSMNLLVANKYSVDQPTSLDPHTLWQDGFGTVIWPGEGPPQVNLISVGDIVSAQADRAASVLHHQHGIRSRRVYLADLSVPTEDTARSARFHRAVGGELPSLAFSSASLHTTRAALAGLPLLAMQNIYGYSDPPMPMTGTELMGHSGVSAERIVTATLRSLVGKAT